jgi:hypothetical protein
MDINPPLIILFSIVIILIILFIILNMTGVNNWAQQRETIIIPATPDCDVALDSLIPINTDNDICCYNNGELTGAYFVSVPINATQLGFSVIPVSTYYINVCRQFCNSGYTLNTDGTIQCNGENSNGNQTTQANNCVQLIKPQINNLPCNGSALPLAALGINPYYAFNADTITGIAQCQVLGPCPSRLN